MEKSNSWISEGLIRPEARIRLFCFPFAGGSAGTYRRWSQKLPAEIEVCPVELPGHGRRIGEKPHTQLPQLVALAREELSSYFDLPFALFGHSLGATVCFELLRTLESEQAPRPVWLFVSGQRAPHRPDSRPPLHNLPDDEFLRELRRFRGTPPEVFANSELMDIFLPILRADFTLGETHRFVDSGPVGCPISVYGGLDDDEICHEDLNQWQRYTTEAFSVREFPGNHFFLDSSIDEVTAAVAKDLSGVLDG